MADKHDDKSTIKEFKKAVNMSAKVLDSWLKTGESKEVGYKENDAEESVGHQSGRRIVELLKKKPDDYTDDDIKHAQKVVGYIHRHLAQKPKGDTGGNELAIQLNELGTRPKKPVAALSGCTWLINLNYLKQAAKIVYLSLPIWHSSDSRRNNPHDFS